MEDVVGRGTVLAGRYRTLQPLASDLPGASSWEARDQILDRPVRVTVLHAGHVAQALDAARRAALVTDPRLVRVLDVGEHEGVAYTVTEQVTGPSLAELVARGPLPADQARAIVGEAAAALEAARRRGVHHLTLRPSVLHLTPDDRVLVTGLAVDGALLDRDVHDAAAATRADTVGLVRLLYAALTGRWPGAVRPGDAGPLPHLAAAPVLEGAPVPPAELTSGVPNDLDTLCAVTLGVHDDGPQTPAELVQELEPWGDIRATDLFAGTQVLPATRSTPPPASAPTADRPPAPARVQRTSVRSVFAGSTAVARPGTPPPAVPSRSAAFTGPVVGASAAAAQATPTAPLPTAPRPTAPPSPTTPSRTAPPPTALPPASPAGRPAPDDAPTTAIPTAPAAGRPGATAPQSPRPPRSGPAPATERPRTASRSTAPPAAPAARPTPATTGPSPDTTATTRLPATAPAGTAASPPVAPPPAQRTAPAQRATPGKRTPPTGPAGPAAPAARTAPARPPVRTPAPRPSGRPERPAAAPARPTRAPAAAAALAATAAPGTADVGTDRPPLLPSGSRGPGGLDVAGARETIAAHRFDPTRFVLLLVLVAIVVGMFAATRALTRPVDLGEETAAPVATPSAPAPAPAAPAPAPDAAPPAVVAPVIASAAQLDPPPEGDDNEHPEAVPLAIDGDPSTAWFTRTYNAADYGNLKSGIGYAVTLTEPATVSTVTLQVLGTGGRVEVRATDPTTPTQGDVLAEGALGPETVLTLTAPTEAAHVVLWFTELPQTADGAFRLELAEVALS